MTPLKRNTVLTAGEVYALPFVGPINHTHTLAVDITALTVDEIDADGYLKPGLPLDAAGALVGVAPAYVFGVTIEPLKVAESNSAADIAAAGTVDIAVATIGQVNRAVAEDILGRALTANEVAGFAAAGSTMKLLE